jgi:hypothetical protein
MLNVIRLSVIMLSVVAPKISYTVHCIHAPMLGCQTPLTYFATAVSYECKMFIILTPVVIGLNSFLLSLMLWRNKLDRL